MNNVERLKEIRCQMTFLKEQNQKLRYFLITTKSPIEKTNLAGRIEMNQDEIFKLFHELLSLLFPNDVDTTEPKL